MNGRVYYNENNPFAAAWLDELMRAGAIPRGHIDTRSIVDVRRRDLEGFEQCHFFAGIGGWAHALELAGWPVNRRIWTASCPCQPLSSAGQRKGHADERHLWPAFFNLLPERDLPTLFGEQVASADGREWFSGIRVDLESVGYAVGGADLCAASVGAPHIRQRIYWVADADERKRGRLTDSERCDLDGTQVRRQQSDSIVESSCADGGLGHTAQQQQHRGGDAGPRRRDESTDPICIGERMADGIGAGLEGHAGNVNDGHEPGRERAHTARSTAESGGARRLYDTAGARQQPAWERTEDQARDKARLCGPERGRHEGWRSIPIQCADGKLRRIPANEKGEPESSLFPLAYGVPNRVGTLRGAGNAIVPQVAAEFIKAFM